TLLLRSNQTILAFVRQNILKTSLSMPLRGPRGSAYDFWPFVYFVDKKQGFSVQTHLFRHFTTINSKGKGPDLTFGPKCTDLLLVANHSIKYFGQILIGLLLVGCTLFPGQAVTAQQSKKDSLSFRLQRLESTHRFNPQDTTHINLLI